MTSDSVRFSVILPLYNKEESVGKTVRSVLSQTHEDLELIVVNDGSTDESLRVVRGIKDDRIRVFSQENQGVSVARNRGMDEAKYNYVAFIDGDDLWHKDYLAVMSCLISKHLAARCFSASWSAWSRIDELPNDSISFDDNRVRQLRYVAESRNDVAAHICSIVVDKQAALEVGGFPRGVKFLEDQEFCCKLARFGDFIHYTEPLVFYVRDAENRACDNKVMQDMPPYFTESEDLMLRDPSPGSYEWYFKEYLVARYLSECVHSGGGGYAEKQQSVEYVFLKLDYTFSFLHLF